MQFSPVCKGNNNPRRIAAFVSVYWLTVPLSILLLAAPPVAGIIIGRKVDKQPLR